MDAKELFRLFSHFASSNKLCDPDGPQRAVSALYEHFHNPKTKETIETLQESLSSLPNGTQLIVLLTAIIGTLRSLEEAADEEHIPPGVSRSFRCAAAGLILSENLPSTTH